MSRICLVGAGYIARVHADALRRMPGHSVTTVVDPNLAAAQRLAASVGAKSVFGTLDEALAAESFDRAHVLVPPDLHEEVASRLLAAGKPVLLEKPLAASPQACARLVQQAAASGTALGVNQNFVHHPAFVRLRTLLEKGELGRPNFLSCVYNVPLRQLITGQLGHWMFQQPGNILLEQAVHPLSQIVTLAGSVGEIKAMAGPAREIAPRLDFVATLDAALKCARLPAQLRFAVGQNFPFWQMTVVCDDGVAVADILADRVFTYRRTRWLEAVDRMFSGIATGSAVARDAVRGFLGYVGSTLHLAGTTDPFLVSMGNSIKAFHSALDAGAMPALDGAFGAELVDICEAIRIQTMPAAPVTAPATAAPAQADACDVAILGGTGFIGAHVVRRFVEAGKRVSVMARGVRNLPAIFGDPRVELHRGSIHDREAVERAIGRAPVVINLAHGGGGGTWEEIRQAMVGGAEVVAQACLALKVRRLIHVGSIASLYLGPQPEPVSGKTAPDPLEQERAEYARAKVLCDRMLIDLHASEGLPVVIVRPGVVVGAGSSPFHSGLGFYNNDQHCIGWNDGRNPLPFVLVGDVAEALLLASSAESINGRCYNLVGGVRPSARTYIADLGRVLGRPLKFHPQSASWLWLEDVGKWTIKRATGRQVPMPSRRDFISRGMAARFDCADAERDLGWHPTSDAEEFRRQALLVHVA